MTAKKTKKPPKQHPIQPLELDVGGTLRFKQNEIVRHLLDHGGIDLNQIAILDFSKEDRQQFAQLIGYSLGGYSELSYVDDDAYRAAEAQKEDDPRDAEIAMLKDEMAALRDGLREPIARLFGKHPDDLRGES